MTGGPWMPDGHGLSQETRELYAEHGAPVHLRLTSLDSRSSRSACDEGIGELWTGRAHEVTCQPCLELVHA